MDGDWIDRYVMELSEWGARITDKGYLVEETTDLHPFAWDQIIDPENRSVANSEDLGRLWQQTRKHLAGFPGRTREIEGRPYVSFSDYQKWRGRRPKGNLRSGLSDGLAVSGWNDLVRTEGGEGVATLALVKIARLDCYAEVYLSQICQDSDCLAEQLARRSALLVSLEIGKPGEMQGDCLFEEARLWKGRCEDLLVDLYSLNQSIDSINRRYFDGQQSLFAEVAEGIKDLLASEENLVELFNDAVADELDYQSRIQGKTDPAGPGLPLSPICSRASAFAMSIR